MPNQNLPVTPKQTDPVFEALYADLHALKIKANDFLIKVIERLDSKDLNRIRETIKQIRYERDNRS